MMSRFDDLARALAGGLTRREAVRAIGAGLAGGLLAALGLGKARGGSANSACEKFCSQNEPGHTKGCHGACVSSCQHCVHDGGFPCDVDPKTCQVVCCEDDATCCGGQAGTVAVCCSDDEVCCGRRECCDFDQCCPDAAGNLSCCPDDLVCCAPGLCCPESATGASLCCKTSTGKPFCCPVGTVCCGPGLCCREVAGATACCTDPVTGATVCCFP